MRRYFREHRAIGPDQQRAWYERSAADSRQLMFAITDVGSGELVGATGLVGIHWVHRHADFSLYIGPGDAYVDERYAPDAARLLLRHGFDQVGLHRVWVEVYAFDAAKQRLVESLGFQLEGPLAPAQLRRRRLARLAVLRAAGERAHRLRVVVRQRVERRLLGVRRQPPRRAPGERRQVPVADRLRQQQHVRQVLVGQARGVERRPEPPDQRAIVGAGRQQHERRLAVGPENGAVRAQQLRRRDDLLGVGKDRARAQLGELVGGPRAISSVSANAAGSSGSPMKRRFHWATGSSLRAASASRSAALPSLMSNG